MTAKRKKKSAPARKGSPAKRAARGFYTTLVVLSALIVGLWCVYKLGSQAPTYGEMPSLPTIAPAATDDPATDDVDESQTVTVPVGRQRKDKTWTFLLVAKDQVSGNTDTIMVCTYDTVNQKIGLVSVPRDTFVIREGYRYRRINGAYASGGIEELMGAVSQTLGIPIDHYVVINTSIFVELIDAAGGVDFDVPVHMAYDDPYQDLHIHYEPGLQHLTGQQALEVVRCRKNSDGENGKIYDAYPDADIGRTRTQQALLTAVAKKVLSTPQNLTAYIELFFEHVKTDLSLANLMWLSQPALKFDFENLTTATLPGNGNAKYGNLTYLYALNVEGSLEIINDCLNPYTEPVTEDMVYMPQGD